MNWLAIACVFGSLCVAQTNSVPSPGKSFAFNADFVRQPIPHFKDGYILAYDHDRTKITAWDASGGLSRSSVCRYPMQRESRSPT